MDAVFSWLLLGLFVGVVGAGVYFFAKPRYDRARGSTRLFYGALAFAAATAAILVLIPLFLGYSVLVSAWRIVRMPYILTAANNEDAREYVVRSIPAILLILALATSVWSLIVNLNSDSPDFGSWGEGFLQNFSTEMLGAYLTYLLFERILGARERQEHRHESSLHALYRLRAARDSSQRQLILDEMAELDLLEGIPLIEVDLRGLDVRGADLKRADLTGANLRDALLVGAELTGTKLQNADLRGADLTDVVWSVNPEYPTDLTGARLENARINDANYTIKASRGLYIQSETGLIRRTNAPVQVVLPDGTRWSKANTFARFIDPAHPDFWRPEDKHEA